MTTWIYLR